MSLLSYLARVREIKSEEKRAEYSQKVKAAEQGFLNPEPGTSEEDIHKAYQKYVGALNINPQEDVQQHGGMFGTLGHLLHLTAKKAAVNDAQKGLADAKQAQAEAAPGMGMPAAGPSSTTPPTIPPPSMPLPDASELGSLAPPDTSNLTTSGVNTAAGLPSPTPLQSSAGAESTPPALPPPPTPPGPPSLVAPHQFRPATTLERAGMSAQQAAQAGLATDAAKIAQRQHLLQTIPQLAKLEPFQQAEFLTSGVIQRSLIPHSQFGPPQALSDEVLKLFPTDSETGAPLTGASFIKPVLLNGQVIGMTRADVLGTGTGAPVLVNGQWVLPKINKTTGDVAAPGATPNTLGGTPASIVAAGAPTERTTATEHPVVVQDADGNQHIQMVPVNSKAITQKKISGSQSNSAPILDHPATAANQQSSSTPRPAGGGRIIETGGKKVVPAQREASKIGQEYEAAVGAANDMKTFTDLARSGNKVAYSYIPTEGVLTLNTSRGVKRVNMAEIHSYGGAGSAWDKVVGWLGKNTTGASIPANILDAIDELHSGVVKNAKDVRNGKLKVINGTYGTNIAPVESGAPNLAPPGGISTAEGYLKSIGHR